MDSQKTIAIIEDEALVRAALTALLRTLGFVTVAYGSAEAFLAGYSVQNFDCILMDQNLPGMSGLELSEYLRGKKIDMPRVIMTGRDEPAVRQKCEQSGIPLFIKPVDAAMLKQTIEAATAPG